LVPKLGLQSPLRKKPSEIEEKATEQISPKNVATPAPEALKESIDYIIHHALGKGLSKEEEREAQHYAQKLKYPKGALVFNGSGEEDFFTASWITKGYPSAGRWEEASDF
jgi:hypothetical protein